MVAWPEILSEFKNSLSHKNLTCPPKIMKIFVFLVVKKFCKYVEWRSNSNQFLMSVFVEMSWPSSKHMMLHMCFYILKIIKIMRKNYLEKCANVQLFTYSPERSKVMSDCVMTFLTLKVTTFDMIHSYSSWEIAKVN